MHIEYIEYTTVTTSCCLVFRSKKKQLKELALNLIQKYIQHNYQVFVNVKCYKT